MISTMPSKERNNPNYKWKKIFHSKPFWAAIIIVVFIIGYEVYPRATEPSDTTPNTNPGNTPTLNTVTDIEGNVYRTVKIGNQTWMAENLRTTRLNDGQSIYYRPSSSGWASVFAPAYCWPNNDTSNKEAYGALYNWYAVQTNKLAPVGWHVPTDDELKILTDYLGGASVAGGKLKELEFSVRWSGVRTYDGIYGYFGEMEKYWSATEGGWHSGDVWYRTVGKFDSSFERSSHQKMDGHSVRCVKDN
jgi:uncharacterized protein (TIGR02145 family)